MAYFIATNGKVYLTKRTDVPKLDTEQFGILNEFATYDQAFIAKDGILTYNPNIIQHE